MLVIARRALKLVLRFIPLILVLHIGSHGLRIITTTGEHFRQSRAYTNIFSHFDLGRSSPCREYSHCHSFEQLPSLLILPEGPHRTDCWSIR
jgi:hypothetical protein